MPKINYITPIGDDFIIPLQFFQADGVTPANMTGASVALLLKPDDVVADSDPSVNVFAGGWSNQAQGAGYVEIPNSISVSLFSTYYYKIKVTTGTVTTIAYGVISFTRKGANAAINTISGLTITMSSGVVVTINYKQDQFTGNTGTPTLTLSGPPHSNLAIVFINGILAQPATQYTISGTTFNWIGTALVVTDQLMIAYVTP